MKLIVNQNQSYQTISVTLLSGSAAALDVFAAWNNLINNIISYYNMPEEYKAIAEILNKKGECDLKFIVLNLRHENSMVRLFCDYILTNGFKDIMFNVETKGFQDIDWDLYLDKYN